jgi:homoserine dehydrogenase
VRSAHYLRVPVQAAADIAAVAELLAAQRLPVRQLVLANGPADAAPQVLVITESALQGAVDLALHALQASPVVDGPVIALRVETLDD